MATVKADGLEKFAMAFKARVAKIEEKFGRDWLSGIGPDAKFAELSRGWFVLLDGSHEALFAGVNKPDIAVGDMAVVRVSFYGRQ